MVFRISKEKHMKKALVVFIAGLTILLGALCWEYILDRHAGEDWVRDFEKRLHDKEAEAESLLKQFRDSVNIDEYVWEEDIVFVGFRNKKVFFWTNEIIGMDGLYDGLNIGR